MDYKKFTRLANFLVEYHTSCEVLPNGTDIYKNDEGNEYHFINYGFEEVLIWRGNRYYINHITGYTLGLTTAP